MMMLIAELCTVLKQRERYAIPQEDCRRVAHLPSLGCEPVGG